MIAIPDFEPEEPQATTDILQVQTKHDLQRNKVKDLNTWKTFYIEPLN